MAFARPQAQLADENAAENREGKPGQGARGLQAQGGQRRQAVAKLLKLLGLLLLLQLYVHDVTFCILSPAVSSRALGDIGNVVSSYNTRRAAAQKDAAVKRAAEQRQGPVRC